MTTSWPVSGRPSTSATGSSASNLQQTDTSLWAYPQVSLTGEALLQLQHREEEDTNHIQMLNDLFRSWAAVFMQLELDLISCRRFEFWCLNQLNLWLKLWLKLWLPSLCSLEDSRLLSSLIWMKLLLGCCCHATACCRAVLDQPLWFIIHPL